MKKKIIADHFNEMANKSEIKKTNQYGSENVTPLLRQPYIYIEDIIKYESTEKMKILDFCCGTGNFSIFPALEGHEVYGIDISKKSIELAKEKIKLFNLNKCNFYCMDSESTNFEENFFDLILCYNSLTYLDLPIALKDLKRVLKPNGKLIIMDSLGHNVFYNFNRKINFSRWGKNLQSEFKLMKMSDIVIFEKYFSKSEIKYFGFLCSILYFLNIKLKIDIHRSISAMCIRFDNFIFNLPFTYFLAFKFVAVFHLRQEK